MIVNWWQQLDVWARHALPAATALAAVLIDQLPLPTPAASSVTPFVTLGVIFFWSLYRPDLMTAGTAFLIGVTFDALAGLPLGLTALVLLIVRGVMVAHQRFFLAKSFIVVWCCFFLLAPVAEAVRWLIASMWWGRLFALDPLVYQIGLTVALYPLVSWLLVLVYRQMPRISHAR